MLERNKLECIEKNYAKLGGTVSKPRFNRIIEHGNNPILDIGCGNGGYVKGLSNAGLKSYGIDIFHPCGKSEILDKIVIGSGTNLPF